MADGSYAGQNGAMGMRSGAFSQRSDFSNWIQSWYDEVEDFPGGNVSPYSQDGKTPGKMVGHYTQVSSLGGAICSRYQA